MHTTVTYLSKILLKSNVVKSINYCIVIIHLSIDEIRKYFISGRFAKKFIKISKESKKDDFN